jgi:ketosteroid isomerase-like protein
MRLPGMRACPVRREERQTTGKRYTWGIARGVTAWMDQHLADDVVWHVGGNSKWAGAYRGKQRQGHRGLGMAENDAAVDPFLDALPG